MYDKRVHRGNSYAAMVIPAGTNHDTMIMEKRQQTIKKRTFKPGDRVGRNDTLLTICLYLIDPGARCSIIPKQRHSNAGASARKNSL